MRLPLRSPRSPLFFWVGKGPERASNGLPGGLANPSLVGAARWNSRKWATWGPKRRRGELGCLPPGARLIDALQDVRDGLGGLVLRRCGAISGGLLPLVVSVCRQSRAGSPGAPAKAAVGGAMLTRSRVRRPGRVPGRPSATQVRPGPRSPASSSRSSRVTSRGSSGLGRPAPCSHRSRPPGQGLRCRPPPRPRRRVQTPTGWAARVNTGPPYGDRFIAAPAPAGPAQPAAAVLGRVGLVLDGGLLNASGTSALQRVRLRCVVGHLSLVD